MMPRLGFLVRACATVGLTTALAFAYPEPGSLSMTGPSDLVGLYSISNPSNTVTEYGYGGGFTAVINGYQATMFCVDFANSVSIPSGPIAVNISTIYTGSNLADTRFYNASFRTINSFSTNGGLSAGDANYLNTADYFQRYQMAAFLVSSYQFVTDKPTSDTYYSDPTNLGIQSAIWMLLDGTTSYFLPPDLSQDGNVGTWLTNAANWLRNGGDEALMAKFHIISDASIAGSTDRLNTGIQEFLTMDRVPEPSSLSMIFLAAVGLIWFARRQCAVATARIAK